MKNKLGPRAKDESESLLKEAASAGQGNPKYEAPQISEFLAGKQKPAKKKSPKNTKGNKKDQGKKPNPGYVKPGKSSKKLSNK